MKKIICAIVAGISVVAAFGQAVRTYMSIDDLVAASHNPSSQNTVGYILDTNDFSFRFWIWWPDPAITNLAGPLYTNSLRPGVVGRYVLTEPVGSTRSPSRGDNYITYNFITNYIATNTISGASLWTNSAGIVRLINMTLPVKITNWILLSDGGTNVLFVDPSNGRDLVLSNSATTPPVFLQVKSAGTPGTSAKFGVLSDGSTKVMSSSGKSIWLSPNAGIDGDYLFSNTAIAPSIANKSLGQYGYPFTNEWLNGYLRIQGTNDGVGNYSYTDFSQQNTNSPFVINQQTGGTAGYSRGFSFRTNGVEVFNVTGTGGPSSGANWTAVGTTDSSLAGTASMGAYTVNGFSPASPQRISLVPLGDSIVQNIWPYTNFYSNLSWANRACLMSGGFIHIPYNAGIGSDTTANMLARFAEDVLTYRPSHCAIAGGMNDVNTGVTPATTYANLLSIVDLCISNNIKPILCTVTPSISQNTNILALNTWIKMASLSRGIPCVDFCPELADSTGALTYNGFGDGIHPDYTGEGVMAKTFIRSMGIPTLSQSALLCYQNNDVASGLTNMLNPSTSVWDFSLTNSVGNYISTLADSSITGNWIVINKPNATGYSYAIPAVHGTFSVGDRLLFTGRYKSTVTDAPGGAEGATIMVQYNGHSANDMFSVIKSDTNSYPSSVFSFEGTVPTDCTTINVIFKVNGIAGTFQAAQFKLLNLTTYPKPTPRFPDMTLSSANIVGEVTSNSQNVTNYVSFGGTTSTNQLYAVGTNLFWNGKQVTVSP